MSNNIAGDAGGGISAHNLVNTVTIENSTIENNQALTGTGGGIHVLSGTATITDSKIRYNIAETNGGGIDSTSTTTIRRSAIQGNVARTGIAGGISQYDKSLVMVDSTVSANRAAGNGGGIVLEDTATASLILRSTIAFNSGASGGGLRLKNTATTSIRNSTVSANVASTSGGGISADAPNNQVSVQNSTLAFNKAAVGGGIHNDAAAPVVLQSTIVAHNAAALGTENLSNPFFGPEVFPFLMSSCLMSTAATDGVADQGGNRFAADPKLAPLSSNGSLTQTHALRRGSPAIDKGMNPANLTTDQRGAGFPRLVGAALDIGAYEWTNTALPAAMAGTFTVSNLNDSGPGSLRQAIIDANNRSGFDTIVFKPGLEGSIQLTSGQMQITSAMEIKGPGGRLLTVDGNGLGRIFVVSGPRTTMNVTISGLTLYNGAEEIGGAIANTANLKLIGMVLMGNLASSGGAVFNNGGFLTIQKSRLFMNTALAGGGAVGAGGGGVVRIEDTSISGNQASNGGGVSGSQCDLIILRTTISGNRAEVTGGGVYGAADLGALAVQQSTIEGNYAGVSGDGVATPGALGAPLIVTASAIRHNRSEGAGGGIAANGLTTIGQSTISGNVSFTGPAGGISQVYGRLTLVDSTLANNRALAGDGGGLYIDATSEQTIIRRCTISGNWANRGGGVYAGETVADLLMQNTTISGNSLSATGGTAIGGGAYLGSNASARTIQNCTVAFNRGGWGGGMFTGYFANVESTIVAYNFATAYPDSSNMNNGDFILKSSLLSTPFVFGLTDGGGNQFNVDPRLAPLAMNGGLTATHALKKGSAAVNRGSNPSNQTTDQRGGKFLRKLGSGVDIGAFERE